MRIRFFDIALALFGLIIFSPIIISLSIIGLFDTGSPFFLQKRLGRDRSPFTLVKFRTMAIGTSEVGTHLAQHSDITKLGHFLRKSKLDELPQLINVLLGDMSLVGPRPSLPSQKKLEKERLSRNLYEVRPGVTGLGQINNIDMSTPRKLARYDQLLNNNLNLCLYFQIIVLTLKGKGSGDKIKALEKSISEDPL